MIGPPRTCEGDCPSSRFIADGRSYTGRSTDVPERELGDVYAVAPDGAPAHWPRVARAIVGVRPEVALAVRWGGLDTWEIALGGRAGDDECRDLTEQLGLDSPLC